jgi:hypothetical protein
MKPIFPYGKEEPSAQSMWLTSNSLTTSNREDRLKIRHGRHDVAGLSQVGGSRASQESLNKGTEAGREHQTQDHQS